MEFMNTTILTNADLLRDVLARDPCADLDTIQQSHPRLGALSADHLGLLLERLIAADRPAWPR